jgi:hypothetical protein
MNGAAFMSMLAKELAEEKAQGLGRVEHVMTAALEKYRQHASENAPAADDECEALFWELSTAVASFVIQREACGLRDTDRVLKQYGIPAEVVARLGARRAAAATC